MCLKRVDTVCHGSISNYMSDLFVSHTKPSGRHCMGAHRGSREFPVSSSSSWLSGEMCAWVWASRRRCRQRKLSSTPKTIECSWADVMSKTCITWNNTGRMLIVRDLLGCSLDKSFQAKILLMFSTFMLRILSSKVKHRGLFVFGSRPPPRKAGSQSRSIWRRHSIGSSSGLVTQTKHTHTHIWDTSFSQWGNLHW